MIEIDANTTIMELLELSREVTYAKRKQINRGWTLHEQICHIHSEASEVYNEHKAGNDTVIKYEIADIIFSAITLFHVIGMSDNQIMYALNEVLKKIRRRVDLP